MEQAGERPDVLALDADLKLDCGLIPFQERFPERFIECGIAEQDMVSMAGGLARNGFVPVVHSFSCFLTGRANEQIYNNATEGNQIIYVGSLAGVLPGGPGHSHQSIRDIAVLASVPGMTLLEPCCEAEVALALDWCINGTPGSSFLRLVSIPCEKTFEMPDGYTLEPGRGAVLCKGDDAAVFTYGPVLVEQAWRAAELLRAQGINIRVIALPWLNSIDREWFVEHVRDTRAVVTVDNHLTIGGQGQFLARTLHEIQVDGKVTLSTCGLHSVPVCGSNDEVLHYHCLDSKGIVEAVERTVKIKESA